MPPGQDPQLFFFSFIGMIVFLVPLSLNMRYPRLSVSLVTPRAHQIGVVVPQHAIHSIRPPFLALKPEVKS